MDDKISPDKLFEYFVSQGAKELIKSGEGLISDHFIFRESETVWYVLKLKDKPGEVMTE